MWWQCVRGSHVWNVTDILPIWLQRRFCGAYHRSGTYANVHLPSSAHKSAPRSGRKNPDTKLTKRNSITHFFTIRIYLLVYQALLFFIFSYLVSRFESHYSSSHFTGSFCVAVLELWLLSELFSRRFFSYDVNNIPRFSRCFVTEALLV